MICIRGFRAGSVALHRSLSWLAQVLSTLPIPPWLGPGASASDRAQHLTLQAPTSHQAKAWFWSTSLELKVAACAVVTAVLQSEVQCIPQQMNCDPFPSPTITKCIKTMFLLGVKWATIGRGTAPCHWHWHQGRAMGELAGGQHRSEQDGVTATYRPRKCLLTSANTNFRYSELGFWSHTGLNHAHGRIATLSGH
jgi:hypothetical protein